MKKNRIYGLMEKVGLFKMIKIMRIAIFILFLSLSQTFAVNSYSQQTKLSLDMRNARVEDVIDKIERNSEFFFMYNKNMIDVDRKVDIQVEEKSVNEVLDKIFANTGITYSIKDRQILLISNLLQSGVLELNNQKQKSISGKVTDSSGVPLPGVSVVVKGTTTGTITDENGHYSLGNIPESAIVQFSFVGMRTQEIPIETKSIINATLIDETIGIDEVVAVGYQTQKKADLTGAVSVVDVEQIKGNPVGNAMKALQGKIAGVDITTDGAPGGSATVRIRGIGTLGNNDPLYIIDGIPTKNGLGQINQADIESFQVLKDASSATIYGSRAANGVIIVTTKKGKVGENKITFNSSVSTQNYTTKLNMLNTLERAKVYWQSSVNDGVDPNNHQIYRFDWSTVNGVPVLNNVILPEYIDAAKTMKPADTKWYDEISQTSIIQSYDFSISKGGDKGSSLFSLSYYDNKGIIKETQSKKYTARLNTDYKLLKGKLKVGENLSATFNSNVLIPTGDVLYTALVQNTIVPVHTVDGGWGGPASGMNDRHNPVRLIYDNKQNKGYNFSILGNAFADLELFSKLHLISSFGVDYSTYYARTLRKSYVSGFLSDETNQVTTTQNLGGSWVWQNTLNYNLKFGSSTFDFLLGNEQLDYIYQTFWASRKGLALENLDYSYLDAGTTDKNNGGSGSSYSLLSQFAKINYAYNDRYLASFTIRRDGSSRFGKDNKYGIFPAFSIGWRLSEENFIKSSLPIISNLKLRYGWGKTGNQEIANNATSTLYSAIYGSDAIWNFDSGSAYDISGNGSGQLPSGYTLIQQGNNTLKWESTVESNIGLDFGLFDNCITGSIDYFKKKTSDILLQPAYLAVIGEGGSTWVNGASMENKGLEILLSYQKKLGQDLSIAVTGNLSTYSNKITKLPKNVLTSYAGNGTDKVILGRSVNSMFGYVADGLFKSQEEIDDHAAQPGKALGRIRYKDLNDDGVINDLDRDYIGVGDPDFSCGLTTELTYKNFDFNMFWQAIYGNDVTNSYKSLTDFPIFWAGSNWGKRTLDAWSPQNPNSTIPALTLVDTNNEGRFSTYYVEKGSYLKLRNIQIGYTFKNMSGKMNFSNLRVFIQGSNLITMKSKSFTAPDPENPGNAYPIPAIYTVGVNLTF